MRQKVGRDLPSGSGTATPLGLQLVVVLGRDDRAATGNGEAATIGSVTSPAVHRAVDPPVPVLVDDNGGTWPGQVLGWRGERVYVTYNSGVGLRHLTWVPAARVRRV